MHIVFPTVSQVIVLVLARYCINAFHNLMFLTAYKCAGEAPGSPVASIFSTFPDISPKKVSALHNVFVSPLRSNKVSETSVLALQI